MLLKRLCLCLLIVWVWCAGGCFINVHEGCDELKEDIKGLRNENAELRQQLEDLQQQQETGTPAMAQQPG